VGTEGQAVRAQRGQHQFREFDRLQLEHAGFAAQRHLQGQRQQGQRGGRQQTHLEAAAWTRRCHA
jgi:hypothetical protein